MRKRVHLKDGASVLIRDLREDDLGSSLAFFRELPPQGQAAARREIATVLLQDRGEITRRLNSMAGNARVPGFRPGKAPLKVLEKRYGEQIRSEVVGEMVQSSFFEAISKEKLRPAGTPTIDPLEAEPGQGINYTAVFDVYPELVIPPIDTIEIGGPVDQHQVRINVIEDLEADLGAEGIVDVLNAELVQHLLQERAHGRVFLDHQHRQLRQIVLLHGLCPIRPGSPPKRW